jgi:hypothetical protein
MNFNPNISTVNSSNSDTEDTQEKVEEIVNRVQRSNINREFKAVIIDTLHNYVQENQELQEANQQILSSARHSVARTDVGVNTSLLRSGLLTSTPLNRLVTQPFTPFSSHSSFSPPSTVTTCPSSSTSSTLSYIASSAIYTPIVHTLPVLSSSTENNPITSSVIASKPQTTTSPIVATAVTSSVTTSNSTSSVAVTASTSTTLITGYATSLISAVLPTIPTITASSTVNPSTGSTISSLGTTITSTANPLGYSRISTTMSTLSPQDITDITNIITSNTNSGDYRLKPFGGSPKEAVPWMEEFEYHALSNSWNDDKKKSKLGTFCTGAAREWYTLEVFGTTKSWDDVKVSFYQQFLPVGFESHMRREFRTRKQQIFEPSANYICAMRAILQRSKQTLSESDAVDFIIDNMLPQIAEKVILFNPKSYNELKIKANLVEQSLKATQEGSNDGTLLNISEALNSLSLKSKFNQSPRPLNYKTTYNSPSRTQRGLPRCWNCNRVGHVQANCRSNQRNNQQRNGRYQRNGYQISNYARNNNRGFRRQQNYRNYNNKPHRNLAAIAQNQSDETEQPVNIVGMIGLVGQGFEITCQINKINAKSLVDSGSSVTFMSRSFANKHQFKIDRWKGSTKGYKLADGTDYKPEGQTDVKMTIKLQGISKSVELTIFVVKNLPYDVLIGSNIIRSLGIIIDGNKNSIYYG